MLSIIIVCLIILLIIYNQYKTTTISEVEGYETSSNDNAIDSYPVDFYYLSDTLSDTLPNYNNMNYMNAISEKYLLGPLRS